MGSGLKRAHLAAAKSRGKPGQRYMFTVDWRIEGTYEVAAENAEHAQELFDKDWGHPSGIMPMRDGEVSNDTPEYKVED
jgi:DNA invertase Pin-like site-specific DNA recombinase